MKDVKIYSPSIKLDSFTHLFPSEVYNSLNKKFNFIWDKNTYEYLVVNQTIYNRPKDFYRFIKCLRTDPIVIFIGFEAISPDFNIFDYVITFDQSIISSDRVFNALSSIYFTPLLTTNTIKRNIKAAEKKYFCNFIYSNPLANSQRDLFFDKLNLYKDVHSLGAHKNNIRKFKFRKKNALWSKKSRIMQEDFKFSITFENTLMSGYTTEKIVNSLLANTIPIYWGNPKINELINPNRIINCHDFNNIQEVINRVKSINEDDNLYESIVNSPFLSDDQLQKHRKFSDDLSIFWSNIFNQNRSVAKRIPDGTFAKIYMNWFSRNYWFNYVIITIWRKKIISAIKYIIRGNKNLIDYIIK